MGDEEDREAIRRRRQRLIALAMTGLGGVTGCDEPAPARPAPEVQVASPQEPAMEPVVAEPPAPPDGIVATRAVPADYEAEPDAAERRHAEALKERRNRRPQPCLSVMPSVCLSPVFKPDGEPPER